MEKKLKIIIIAVAIVFAAIFILFTYYNKKAEIAYEKRSGFVSIKNKKEEKPKIKIEKVYKPVALDKESCDELRGMWVEQPLADRYVCSIPTSDSGKECIDEAECQGSCLSEEVEKDEFGIERPVNKGRCSDWTLVLGCRYYMENGEAVDICKD